MYIFENYNRWPILLAVAGIIWKDPYQTVISIFEIELSTITERLSGATGSESHDTAV